MSKSHKQTRSDGTTVRVTVPDDPNPKDLLIDAIRENLSLEAVCLIAAKLQPCYGKGQAGQRAERECDWFTEMLIDEVGTSEYERLCDELGL
jgi:hypothetical protein